MHTRKPKNTEVDAYSFIKTELEKLDWIVKNPARFPDGEVYKQNEALYNTELKKCLDRDMPEAIVKINDSTYWVIESKRDIHCLKDALEDCKTQYAKKINASNHICCPLISGVAGNDSDGYIVCNLFWKKNKWVEILINGQEKTSLLSKAQASFIVESNNPNFSDFPDFSEKLFLTTAENINEILHLAAINKSKRARFIAGVILSFAAKTRPNLDKDTKPLIKEINDNIEYVLQSKGKQDFYDFICLQLPPNIDNHIKYRQAVIQTYRELESLDIKSAMNSGNDVLGKFYEVFLKYGNGAKEIGIVLTPRHITKFAVEALGVSQNDFVLDPTCGTAGFLVAAYDFVKKHSSPKQVEDFRKYRIFGLEQEDDVVALALVNMIFRGDGRNNIREGNCFQKIIAKTNVANVTTGIYKDAAKTKEYTPIISRVLMNPPFALQKSDEKEYHFVNYALSQMEDGGLLFSVLPYSLMVKSGEFQDWRNAFLKQNTLLCVVTFPDDLFYPIGVHTIGFFAKKGTPHPKSQNVLWIRGLNDGYEKKKGKRLESPRAKNDFKEILPLIQLFIANQTAPVKSVPEFVIASPIVFDDSLLELVPEAFLEQRVLTASELQDRIDFMVRETAAFIIKSGYEEKIDETNR